MKSYAEVDALMVTEYSDLMEAYTLHRTDVERDIHWMAFQNFRVRAMKGKGKTRKPVYSKFEKFFNHKQAEDSVLRKSGKKTGGGVFGRLKQHLSEKREDKTDGAELFG